MAKHLLFETIDKLSDYYLEDEKSSITYLPATNAINILIGPNNSGKSRFIIKIINSANYRLIDRFFVNDYDILIEEINKEFKSLGISSYNLQPISLIYNNINVVTNDNITILNSIGKWELNYFKSRLNDLTTIFVNEYHSEVYVKKFFIPTLRTAHTLYKSKGVKLEIDLYTETINQNRELNSLHVEIFTGQQLYNYILNTRNSKKETRKRFEEFEKFLSKNFFDCKNIDVVADFNIHEKTKGNSSGEVIRVHVEGDEDRYLHELGDGIQAIIILMYQIFMAEPDSFIYIDEPELHLHPGMQRLFLEQLCSNKDLKDKNLTYFITTHSNHFLDLTIEKDNVSIYAFSPRTIEGGQKQFVIKNVNAGDNDILKHLGVNNSSVFMANCSIWVEGISDRNYIKAFLKAYTDHLISKESKDFKSIKEDIDYAFFEYAGSNIDHYFFGNLLKEQEQEVINDINALALHNRILLMADSDNATGAKRKRLDDLKAAKAGNFVPIVIEEIKEVENLLTNNIWDAVLIEFCNKKRVEEDKTGIQVKISLAIEKFDYEEHEKDSIGTFLNKIDLEIGDNILNKIYETKADGTFGTFIQKRELSEIVLKKGFGWDIFSKNPEIEKLTKEIYKFIITSKN